MSAAFFLFVQEILQGLLQHTMKRRSANGPHDNIKHPDFEITLEIMAHVISHQDWYQKNLIKNREFQ